MRSLTSRPASLSISRRRFRAAAACLAAALVASAAGAQTVNWTSWTNVTRGTPGSATGTMTIGTTTVGVSYIGEVYGGQTNSGYNYFVPTSTFTSATVPNAPSNPGIVQLVGGNSITNTLTFSAPVQNLFFAIESLGSGSNPTSYIFSLPFTILSQGRSSFGGCTTCLSTNGNTLTGTEGNGTLQFSGPVTTLSWTVPHAEGWHGFTVGAAALGGTSTVPEPSSMALLGTGLVALVPAIRRRR